MLGRAGIHVSTAWTGPIVGIYDEVSNVCIFIFMKNEQTNKLVRCCLPGCLLEPCLSQARPAQPKRSKLDVQEDQLVPIGIGTGVGNRRCDSQGWYKVCHLVCFALLFCLAPTARGHQFCPATFPVCTVQVQDQSLHRLFLLRRKSDANCT